MTIHRNLSRNWLGYKTSIELVAILRALPVSVTHFDLSCNNCKAAAELAEVLRAIPASVTHLDLSENGLYRKTAAELIEILASIPDTVTKINLKNNELFIGKSPQKCDELLNALSPYMSRLDISNNGESNFARAVAPMISAGHTKIPENCAVHVLSFFNQEGAKQIGKRLYNETHDDAKTNLVLEEEKTSIEMKNS